MEDPTSGLSVLRQQLGIFPILFHQVKSARSALIQRVISIHQQWNVVMRIQLEKFGFFGLPLPRIHRNDLIIEPQNVACQINYTTRSRWRNSVNNILQIKFEPA